MGIVHIKYEIDRVHWTDICRKKKQDAPHTREHKKKLKKKEKKLQHWRRESYKESHFYFGLSRQNSSVGHILSANNKTGLGNVGGIGLLHGHIHCVFEA